MKKHLLLPLLTALVFTIAGCANRQAPGAYKEIVHGSTGVRIQSQDTSRFAPAHAPY